MHRTDVFDMAAAARLRTSGDIGMMQAHLVAAQARGVGHIVPRADDRQPARAGDNRLVACIALLREHRVWG